MGCRPPSNYRLADLVVSSSQSPFQNKSPFTQLRAVFNKYAYQSVLMGLMVLLEQEIICVQSQKDAIYSI